MENFIKFIAENWAYLVVGLIAVFAIIKFILLPGTQQKSKIKEWLLYAVTEAEAYLGSGTGKIKLRYVYDMFVSKFRFVSFFVSFETFSAWVDEELEEMREMIESNVNVKEFVGENTDIGSDK